MIEKLVNFKLVNGKCYVYGITENELTRTRCALLQALLDSSISINNCVITINASVRGDRISRSRAAIASVMTCCANTAFSIFRVRALHNTELSIFNVCTRMTVISIGSITRVSTLRVAITAGCVVHLVNSKQIKYFISKMFNFINDAQRTVFDYCSSPSKFLCR